MIVLITFYLTSSEQGLWFSMLSLGGFVFVADLGFTNILSQYISHDSKSVYKNTGALSKVIITESSGRVIVSSFLVYMFVVLFVAIILFFWGSVYFFKSNELTLWASYLALNVVYLFISLAHSVILGLNRVTLVNKEKLVGHFSIAVTTAVSLFMNLGLWSLVIGLFAGCTMLVVTHYRLHNYFWFHLFQKSWHQRNISSLKPLGGLQGRFAISWICGYFIFQLYVPYIYKNYSPELAGKIGLAIAVFTSITQLCSSFVVAHLPKIGNLVGEGNESEALLLFIKGFKRRVISQVIITTLIFSLYYFLKFFSLFEFLFLKLPTIDILLSLSLVFLCSGMISNFAGYIRAHREECFVWHAIINALLIILSLLIFKDVYLLFISISIIYLLILFPYGVHIFHTKLKIYQRIEVE